MSGSADQSYLDAFDKTGARLQGHFVLSSGLHSGGYLQCALVLSHPEHASRLGEALARKVRGLGLEVDTVVSPAMGGLIIGHEVGRALEVRAIFTERMAGIMTLRRGFSIAPGERLLVVEDVLTTGQSTREVLEVLRSLGGTPVAACAIVNRSGGKPALGIPFLSLLDLAVPTWKPEECPLCRGGSGPAIKPGSRGNA